MRAVIGNFNLIRMLTITSFLTGCGTFLVKEEQLTITQLPEPVLQLALRKTDNYEIVGVEKETYRNKVIYSVNYIKDGEEWEYEFDPSGAVVSHELE